MNVLCSVSEADHTRDNSTEFLEDVEYANGFNGQPVPVGSNCQVELPPLVTENFADYRLEDNGRCMALAAICNLCSKKIRGDGKPRNVGNFRKHMSKCHIEELTRYLDRIERHPEAGGGMVVDLMVVKTEEFTPVSTTPPAKALKKKKPGKIRKLINSVTNNSNHSVSQVQSFISPAASPDKKTQILNNLPLSTYPTAIVTLRCRMLNGCTLDEIETSTNLIDTSQVCCYVTLPDNQSSHGNAVALLRDLLQKEGDLCDTRETLYKIRCDVSTSLSVICTLGFSIAASTATAGEMVWTLNAFN